MSFNDSKIAQNIGCFLLITVVATSIWVALFLGVNKSIYAIHPFLGIGTAFGLFVLHARYTKESLNSVLQISGLSIFILLIAILISTAFYDFSFDGQWYHQSAIIHLAHKWNPIHSAPLKNQDLWVNHYPKGLWYFSASLYRLTNEIETGKAYQLILMMAAWLLAFSTLKSWSFQSRTSVFIALLLVLNPIVTSQTFTFYCDGALYLTLLCSVLLGCLTFQKPSLYTIIAWASSIVLLVNIKFTGLVYTFIIVSFVFVYLMLRARRYLHRWIFGTVLTLSVAILIVGFNPYITNLLSKGHPLFPLVTREQIHVFLFKDRKDPGFLEKNRFAQAAISIFSETDDIPMRPTPKIPFAIYSREFKSMVSPDPSIGGFGPWFSGSIILSGILIVCLWFQRHSNFYPWAIGNGLIFISAFISPGAWWARYAPQLWCVPVSVLMLTSIREYQQWIKACLSIILAVNVALVASASWAYQIALNLAFHQQLEELRSSAQEHPLEVQFKAHTSMRLRLEKKHIPYHSVTQLTCSAPARFITTEANFCIEGIGSPPKPPSIEQVVKNKIFGTR